MDNVLSMGIASILAVVRESNHAHFLMSLLRQGQCALAQGQYALAQKPAVNMQFGGTARGKDCFCIHSC